MAISAEMNTGQTTGRTRSRRGTAFLVEALVVLAFLMLALAVFARLFSGAQLEALRAQQLSEAVQVASNCAEEFSANPTGVEESYTSDGLNVSCVVSPTVRSAGTLYKATITVSNDVEELYTLTTSRYVSGARIRGGDAS